MTVRALYYGDNLDVLREGIKDESVDLVYLDPPFNSNANYNLLFRAPSGEQSAAQIEAFEDTWHWNETAESAFDEVLRSGNTDAADLLRAMRSFLKENDMMAYLAMMAVRLLELHRVLKPTGSLYLHCDPTASHYLKAVMDSVFSPEFFQNEITWKRTYVHGDSRTWSRVSDKLFFYTKGPRFTWNVPYEPLSDAYIASHYSNVDESGRRFQLTSILSPSPRPRMMYAWKGFPSPPMGWRFSKEKMSELDSAGFIAYPTNSDGSYDLSKRPRFKRYLDEQKGVVVSTVWTDIPPINSQSQERLGYPTQKPVALLERIISASSNPGDVVLDPFCGCGTATHASEKLGRSWIGIDITHLAISLIERRLKDAFPGIAFEVHGTPKDIGGARDLAQRDKYQFQWWAVSLVEAQPYGGKKKGADSGIDGVIYFKEDKKTTKRVIVSVKGGAHGVAQVRDLKGVLEREKEPLGLFITLETPTQPMVAEAASAGFYDLHGKKIPKIQIATIGDLLDGKKPILPGTIDTAAAFKAAPKEDEPDDQGDMFGK